MRATGTGIVICGLNGAGKSTLGKALAERLGFCFIDSEDIHFSRADTGDAYGLPRTREEAGKLLLSRTGGQQGFVFAAVKGDYGDQVCRSFRYAVWLRAPREARMERLRSRSFRQFGERMLPGGDLYEKEEAFFRFARSREEETVEGWLKTLDCPVLSLDGTRPVEENLGLIMERLFPDRVGKRAALGIEKEAAMNHRGTVTLETERLVLRRFTKNDLEQVYYNCWSDYDVWKWTNYAPMTCIAEVLTNAGMFTDNWINAYEKPNRYSWAIQLKATGEVIGRYFGMHPDDEVKQVELACEIGKKWWNQGYMTEATGKIIEFFFREVGMNRVYAWHAGGNPASGRMQQKAGMKYEGTLRQAGKCNAGVCDKIVYAILAEDYFAGGPDPKKDCR